MKMRKIRENVYWLGVIDWERRLFDSLIPLPDGTSYNAYLIKGSEKTALLDTVDTPKKEILMRQLEGIDNIDYVVSHHAEQDHSGAIPEVLKKYGKAKVLTSDKGRGMIMDLLAVPEERISVVADGETLSLGDKSLTFIYTPWVHWPETMVTYLKEDKILFTCDFFGSHVATSRLYAGKDRTICEAAKRYFAEIMMPFRKFIKKNLEKLSTYEIDVIAPSHGPLYDHPECILEEYKAWVSDNLKNVVVIPYISMHGTTKKMIDYFTSALSERGVLVELYDLSVTDIGKLAMSLVDAGTIVLGTPTVAAGPHPNVMYAAYLANILRPKAKFASIIGSYGWGGKTVEKLAEAIPNLKAEILEPVLSKGLPGKKDLEALDELAEKIARKHKENNFFNTQE